MTSNHHPHPSSAPPELNALPQGTARGLLITAAAAVVAIALYYWLPYEQNANKGLALLAFVAILWLSEAVHITITALMIPILAVLIKMY